MRKPWVAGEESMGSAMDPVGWVWLGGINLICRSKLMAEPLYSRGKEPDSRPTTPRHSGPCLHSTASHPCRLQQDGMGRAYNGRTSRAAGNKPLRVSPKHTVSGIQDQPAATFPVGYVPGDSARVKKIQSLSQLRFRPMQDTPDRKLHDTQLLSHWLLDT